MVAQSSSAHQQNLAHLFSDTETCHFLLIAKYNQLRSGDQKENMGRSYCHVGIQLPQSDQTSAVPPSRVCNTCSREEKKQVTVIGFNTTTLGAVEKKPGTIPSPSVCPSGFIAALLPQKYTGILRNLFSGMSQLSFPHSGSARQDSAQAPSTPA